MALRKTIFFTLSGLLVLTSSCQNQPAAPAEREPASSPEALESAMTCAPEKNYLLDSISRVPLNYRQTRMSHPSQQIPRSCVTYIMRNFINTVDKPIKEYSVCASETDRPQRGAYTPCVTEAYSNSVYNSLVDVADCMNIPLKELLPKLYNESGLHLNTLGGGFDGGVGQLTAPAIQEVFARFDNTEGNPSALNHYLKQMKRSSKASCQRIVADPGLTNIRIPAGKKICMVHEARLDATRPEYQRRCFNPWESNNRCVVISGPQNPLRNIVYTAIFYKSMLRLTTGMNYVAGEDVLWNGSRELPFRGQAYRGIIGNKNFANRMRKLGMVNADENVLRQILVSFGFNAGIDTGKILLDNYLKQREAKRLPLTEADLDFQNVATGKWAIITNPFTYWSGLTKADPADFEKAIAGFEILSNFQMDVRTIQRNYRAQRVQALQALENLQAQNLPTDQFESQLGQLRMQAYAYFKPYLDQVAKVAYTLPLPEYMRIAHAQFARGGAPGYLGFLASKHKQLEREMGSQVCTAEKYLQF